MGVRVPLYILSIPFRSVWVRRSPRSSNNRQQYGACLISLGCLHQRIPLVMVTLRPLSAMSGNFVDYPDYQGMVLTSTLRPAFCRRSRYGAPSVAGVSMPPPTRCARVLSRAMVTAASARHTPVNSYMLPSNLIRPYARFGSCGSETSAFAMARHSACSCFACLYRYQ